MNRALTAFLAMAAASSFAGCASSPGPGGGGDFTTAMRTGAMAPAAEGTVKVGEAPNKNTALELRVRHLTPPEQLDPPRAAYVVWTRAAREAPAQNIGALEMDEHLDAALNTITPLRSFELSITAEPSAQVSEPGAPPLLWADVHR